MEMQTPWQVDHEHYKRLAAYLLSELPLLPRAEASPSQDLFCLEMESSIDDVEALRPAAWQLKEVLARATAYVELELPVAVEHAITAHSEEGPTLRLTRIFVPFPVEGEPRMKTFVHVAYIR